MHLRKLHYKLMLPSPTNNLPIDGQGRRHIEPPVRNTRGQPAWGPSLQAAVPQRDTAGHRVSRCPSTTQTPLTLRRSPGQLCGLSLAPHTSSSQGTLPETASHRIRCSRAFRPDSQLTSCAGVSAKPVCSPEGTALPGKKFNRLPDTLC